MADSVLFQATSADIAPDGTTFVVLRWEEKSEAVGYNIYRRPAADTPPASADPINGGTPVRVPQSSRELRAIVAPGTPAWDTLANLLAAAAGPGGAVGPVDPAEAFDRGLTAAERGLIQAGAQVTLAMGRIAGVAYIDRGAKAGEQYLYDLHGVRADDSTFVLARDLLGEAGAFMLPAPPSGVTTQAGDRRVLVLWNRNPQAATFDVERASNPGGPFVRVNPLPVAYDLAANLDGTPLAPEQPGFLDNGAWDANGLPISHQVLGTWIAGPDTGLNYWYRVASRDALERQGAWSAPVSATPVRSVPPMAPTEVQVMPDTAAVGLVVKWRTVTRNVENHAFTHQSVLDINQSYRIYRAESRAELEQLDLADLASHLVATRPASPVDAATPVQQWHDTAPVLRPPYGTKPFFYRVRAQDAFSIPSSPSATVGAAVPDTVPPGPTDLVSAEGHARHIHIEFKPNPEPDVAGYQIYRGLCDHGWVYVPGIVRKPEGPPEIQDDRYRCDMALVGDVPVGEANAILAVDGIIWFDDKNIPAGSPVCYAYWVRAYDFAGNLYGGDEHACPASPSEYRCASLRERTPPEVPIVTGLRARNNGVLVEWIAAPEQDLRAFHVYRSDLEFDPPRFLACVFTNGTVSPVRWVGTVPSCAAVPAVSDPLAARGSYLDDTAEPHRVYWYRVAALDWLGNESAGSNLLDIPASSTFTYTSDLPPTPVILPQTPPPGTTCGLDIAWDPPFNPAAIKGYVVFRGAPNQPFLQVSDILAASSFTDTTARRGVDYLYTVQAIDDAGTLSEPSPPVLHRY